MSLHKLTAGSGYDYLTRQVAAGDSTDKGHASLATYYTEKGETPGRWIGAGLSGIDGISAGDAVTAVQMKSLFAYGFHPLADERLAALPTSATFVEVEAARRLGQPFKVYAADVPDFLSEVARRIEDSDLLIDIVGPTNAAAITQSPWWPTLVSSVDHAVKRGWQLSDLLATAATLDTDDDVAEALVWRIAIITDPPPDAEPVPYDEPPVDLDDAAPPATIAPPQSIEERLATAAVARAALGPLEPADHTIAAMVDRAWAADSSPISPERIIALNEIATQFYEQQLGGSWAHPYQRLRLGHDLTGDDRFRIGYAPAGWAHLVNHLRRHDVTDEEMLAAGLAKTARTGQLIDRFRDRLMFPIITNGNVIGFSGRRNPDAPDGDRSGPKYLNTPDTIVFHKSAQLYGIADERVAEGSIPVLVEGPVDAIAVTLASAGAYVGVAPLGTALTEEQAAQLATFSTEPIVATDGDLAGRLAAERDYRLLTAHNLDPRVVHHAPGADPASLLFDRGPRALAAHLHDATALADTLLTERLCHIDQVTSAVATVIAVRPSERWNDHIDQLAEYGFARSDLQEATVPRAPLPTGRTRRRRR